MGKTYRSLPAISMNIWEDTKPYGLFWRQKINSNGKLLGAGFFTYISPGKMIEEKRYAAHDKWIRGYGRHKISFDHPGCIWHHVNMMFVVACPKEIHEKCNHHVLGNTGIHAHFLEGVLG